MEPTTEEKNEVIAKWMGAKFINDAPTEFPNGYYYWPDGSWNSIDEFDYHASWDWLMPVVERIEEKTARHFVTIREDRCQIESTDGSDEIDIDPTDKYQTKIQSVHEAVYQFILWHNKQQGDKTE